MEKRDNTRFLGEEKVIKLLLRFSIPCILSLLISSLYNIVDQMFIGNSEVGYLGNAATTVVFPITIIATAFAWCLGDGVAAYMSISQGKQDTSKVHKAVGNSILALVVISIIFLGVGFGFMDPLLTLFGASPASIGLARDYFVIILVAMPAFILMNMINAAIRADGSPGYAMVSMLCGAIINIILDPLFIFGFGWGIKGAAYATVAGQVISFGISAAYLLRSKSFRVSMKSFAIDFGLLWKVIKLGISTFITQMAIVIVSVVSNQMLVKYGAQSVYGVDIPIAVIGIAMKVFTIVISIVVGIVLGAQPIIGYNYGAKNYARVKETFGWAFLGTVLVSGVATIWFQFWPETIIRMFGAESDLYNEFAVMTFRIFLALVVLTCVMKLLGIFFQAVGDPTKAAIVSLTRELICFVPLAIMLPLGMGVKGVLWAAPIADVIGIIVSTFFAVKFFKKMDSDITQVQKEKHVVSGIGEGMLP